jgi:RNA polymerase sigma-70 factor (ECF subfamily)
LRSADPRVDEGAHVRRTEPPRAAEFDDGKLPPGQPEDGASVHAEELGDVAGVEQRLRVVARRLARDEFSADDLEQDAWLAALANAPSPGPGIRGWFRSVLTNRRRERHRAETRLVARERATARAESTRSTAELVAEAEAHRRVVAAVLALPEPHRGTVLLRYFERLPPRAIAAREGVPVETVRTRLKRSSELLRRTLGEDDGDAWLAAIAPLVVGARTGTGGAATAATGGTIMGGKATIAAALALGLAAGLAGGRIAAPAAAPATPGVAELARRIDALEASRGREIGAAGAPDRRGAATGVEELARRLDALEAQVAESGKRTSEIAERVTAESGPLAERRRLDAASTADLLQEVQDLTHTPWTNKADERAGLQRTLRICDVLEARTLQPAQRAQSLTARGTALRTLEDLPGSETALREAMTVGAGLAASRDAACQLAWTLCRRGDPRGGAEQFLSVARHPETTPASRSVLRRMAADFLRSAKEPARARDEYRSVVDEFGASDEPFIRRQVEQAKKSLEELDQETAK